MNDNKFKNRLSNYDLMRVIACSFVLMDHVGERPFPAPVKMMYTTVFFTANGLFYMMSGKFNLNRSFSTAREYKNFYRKKFITIFFPYALISFMLTVLNLIVKQGAVSLPVILSTAYVEFMQTNSDKSLWFMYPLIGMIVSAPFLSKMLHAMSDMECRILFTIAVIWNFIRIYLVQNFGIEFRFEGWLLETWTLYFVCGHLYGRLVNDGNRKKLYALGICGYLVTIAGKAFIPDHFTNAHDYSIAFVFFTLAVYGFMEKHFNVRNIYVKRAVYFLAEHTFLIYLLHGTAIKVAVRILPDADTTTVPGFLLRWLCISVISLAGAVIVRALIIKPLQSLLRKMPGLRETVPEKSTS